MTRLIISKKTHFADRYMEYALYFLVAGVSISNTMTGMGVGAVLLLWAVKRLILKKVSIVPKAVVILGTLVFLAHVLSLLNSEYLGQSLRALFLRTGQYLLLVFAISEGVKEKRVAVNMALVLCVTATFLCFDGFFQFFSGRDLLLSREAGRLDVFYGDLAFHSFRITANFPAANLFASYLVAVLMVGLSVSIFLGNSNSRSAFGLGVILASMLLCLFLTFSRGGAVACFVGALFLAILLNKKQLWVIPVLFLLVLGAGTKVYGNRAPAADLTDPTLETRITMLKDAVKIFRMSPWTGIGLNTYYKAHEKYRSSSLPASYAHNSYAQMLAEVGIVGFFAFLSFMVYWFYLGLQTIRKFHDYELKCLLGGVLAGVLGLCVHALFDNVLYSLMPATLFWVLIGYGIALTRIGSESNS